MPTIKNIGQKPTMLNGFIVQEGHIANVNETQANSLINDHPDQWVLVGGAAKVQEAKVPDVPDAIKTPVKKGKGRRAKAK